MTTPKLDNRADGLNPYWKNWRQFLRESCRLRAKVNGYRWYSASNCHYIVNPNGSIICPVGYHAWNVWRELTGEPVSANPAYNERAYAE